MCGQRQVNPHGGGGPDDRQRLVRHLERVILPGIEAWFVDQIVGAIELAARDTTDAWIEVNCRNRRLSDVITEWRLERFVTEAKGGVFDGRAGAQSSGR